jgi:GAF domain-containing protein
VTPGDEDFASAIRDLAGFLLTEEDPDTTIGRVVEIARRIVPGSEAGIVLLDGDVPTSVAATSERVVQLQDLQRTLSEGPSLDALKERAVVSVVDTGAEQRWGRFMTAAKDLGIASILCFPLVTLNEPFGVLSFFSESSDAFDEAVFSSGAMMAAQAAVAIHNSQLYLKSVQLAAQLSEALESRAVIDQAKGILMEREGIGADAAFGLLRQASQNVNVKVRDIAQQMVDQVEPKEPPSST